MKIIIRAMVGISAVTVLLYFGLTSAQQRATFTPEQLEILRIRQIPDKEGLYLMPGFDGSMSGGNIAILVTEEESSLWITSILTAMTILTGRISTATIQPIRYA